MLLSIHGQHRVSLRQAFLHAPQVLHDTREFRPVREIPFPNSALGQAVQQESLLPWETPLRSHHTLQSNELVELPWRLCCREAARWKQAVLNTPGQEQGCSSHPVPLQTRAAPPQNCPSPGLEEKKGIHLLSLITQCASLSTVFFPLTAAFGAFALTEKALKAALTNSPSHRRFRGCLCITRKFGLTPAPFGHDQQHLTQLPSQSGSLEQVCRHPTQCLTPSRCAFSKHCNSQLQSPSSTADWGHVHRSHWST